MTSARGIPSGSYMGSGGCTSKHHHDYAPTVYRTKTKPNKLIGNRAIGQSRIGLSTHWAEQTGVMTGGGCHTAKYHHPNLTQTRHVAHLHSHRTQV